MDMVFARRVGTDPQGQREIRERWDAGNVVSPAIRLLHEGDLVHERSRARRTVEPPGVSLDDAKGEGQTPAGGAEDQERAIAELGLGRRVARSRRHLDPNRFKDIAAPLKDRYAFLQVAEPEDGVSAHPNLRQVVELPGSLAGSAEASDETTTAVEQPEFVRTALQHHDCPVVHARRATNLFENVVRIAVDRSDPQDGARPNAPFFPG